MEGSRIVLDIDYRLPGNRSRSAIINEEGIRETTNAYEKYTTCNVSWVESSYFHILTCINTKCTL